MIGFLYALIVGGLAAALGGGGGGTGPAIASSSTVRNDPDDPLDSSDDAGGRNAPGVSGAQDLSAPASSGDANGPSNAPSVPESAYDIGWDGLSAEEQLIVELVNRARLDPLSEVEIYDEALAAGIPSRPVQALAVNAELSAASLDHSEDMDNRDFFAHTNPDGDSPSDRAIEAGHGSRFVGENVGWIGSTFAPDAQERADDHHENLWRSDGHQRNLMSDNWSEIGLGYDKGSYLGYNHSTFVTQMFGDKGQTFLTGVVIDDEDGDRFYDLGEGQGEVKITAYADDQVYATATWEAGGYSLALPRGTYKVVFEGGDLDAPYETEVTIGDENVKLDVIEGRSDVMATLDARTMLPSVSIPDDAQVLSFDAGGEDAEDLMLF